MSDTAWASASVPGADLRAAFGTWRAEDGSRCVHAPLLMHMVCPAMSIRNRRTHHMHDQRRALRALRRSEGRHRSGVGVSDVPDANPSGALDLTNLRTAVGVGSALYAPRGVSEPDARLANGPATQPKRRVCSSNSSEASSQAVSTLSVSRASCACCANNSFNLSLEDTA